jgi:cysteine-rich repeat protein
VIAWGPTATAAGTFLGFETCDDGNTTSGDGCSARCQREPAAALGQISLMRASLCVIRSDETLACWGDAAEGAPAGSFRQVALSAYHGCALGTDGAVVCWRIPGTAGSFAPTDRFTQIEGDYNDTCGLREDGGITCWDDTAVILDQPGPFDRVDVNRTVCGLSAGGLETCWEPYATFPSGPFVQTYPALNGDGCGLRPSGELVCVPDTSTFVHAAPLAGLVSVHVDDAAACGVRPDGRAVYFRQNDVNLLLQDDPFIEVVAGFTFCCGLTPDRRAYCSANTYGLPAE